MSKHVGNVTEVSSLMKILVRNKLEMHALRSKAETNQSLHTGPIVYFYPGKIPLLTGFLLVR